jgi:2-C-methyl-D-erythritol 4-phosphate cytidylyltransferase
VVTGLAGSAGEFAEPAGDRGARAVLLAVDPPWPLSSSSEVSGAPLVVHAVRALLDSNVVGEVLLLASRAAGDRLVALLYAEHRAAVRVASSPPAEWLRSSDAVLVHDVLHPLTPVALVATVLAGARQRSAPVVPVLPVTDTIKRLDADGFLLDTVDRAGLRTGQAPLALPARQLAEALATGPATGPASVGELLARLTGPVHTVPGDPLAFELRGPWDVRLAESLGQA